MKTLWQEFDIDIIKIIYFKYAIMNEEIIIEKTIEFVKKSFLNAKPSHDFFHVERVYNMAVYIWEKEGANLLIVKLWALLHDIADYKYHDWDEEVWPEIAWKFLTDLWVDNYVIEEVKNIIKYISFSTNLWTDIVYKSKELDVVKDADKLDAIWAIWVARCMCFSWEKDRELYNPSIEPKLDMTKEEYKKNKSTAINHFYEKLLRLKDLMNTDTWKEIAKERHRFMELYLEQFFKEVNF